MVLTDSDHHNVPTPIPACGYAVINRSLLCNCQLQRENEFLYDSLASCLLADEVGRHMHFTINIAFANQLQMNFPETIPSEDLTSKLPDIELSFSISLQDFTDPESSLESSAKRPKVLK